MLRGITQNIILLVIVVLCVFIAGEVTIRVLGLIGSNNANAAGIFDIGDFRGWRPDPVLNRAHIPGLRFTYIAQDKKEFRHEVEYSSKGLHDYEYTYEKPENTGRILVFGDSFVEAIQVEKTDNFCKVLEKYLSDENTPTDWQVINMGVSGYSPILEYLYLKNEGLKYRPDIVIMCFFMNDVYEDMVYRGMATFDDRGLPVAVSWKGHDKTAKLRGWKRTERRISNGVKAFLKKSIFYTFLKERIYRLLTLLNLREIEPEENQFFILTGNDNPDENRLWDDSFKNILAAKNIAERNNARFLFVVIPMEAEISDNPEDAAFKAYFDGRPSSEKSDAFIERFCDRNGIERVNLLHEFTGGKMAGSKGLYFKNDGHFNQSGHQSTADILFRKLKTLGWVE